MPNLIPMEFYPAPLPLTSAQKKRIAGLVRRNVDARKRDECAFGAKSPHIADLRHELWAEGGTYTEHLHDHWIFR